MLLICLIVSVLVGILAWAAMTAEHTPLPWTGGFRWFRSPNVIPIEQWRTKR